MESKDNAYLEKALSIVIPMDKASLKKHGLYLIFGILLINNLKWTNRQHLFNKALTNTYFYFKN